MPVSCTQCQAEIPPENLNAPRNLAKCPTCGTVFNPASPPRYTETSLLPQLSPKGMALEISGEALLLTRRWFSRKYIFLTFICIFWNLFIFGWAISDSNPWLLFICPHAWVGLGLIYTTLSGYLNSTETQVTPHYLTVRHGPIPHWGNKQLHSARINQLYVKEHIRRNKNSTSYTYEVWVQSENRRDEKLIDGIEKPEQAFFLEQEIERFLQIEDKLMPGEYKLPAKSYEISWKAWEAVAAANDLNYLSSKLLEGVRMTGYYQGYELGLMAFYQKDRPYTRIVLAQAVPTLPEPVPAPQAALKILLDSPFNATGAGKFLFEPDGQELMYEHPGIETDTARLRAGFDALADLLRSYPALIALGGEAMPALRAIAANKQNMLQSLAAQLLRQIAPTTLELRERLPLLWCKRCLTHSIEHAVNISWLQELAYYGCRTCHQSRDFYQVEQVVAVLDKAESTAQAEWQDAMLRVNWAARKTLFDFHRVEIIRADDETVERFAVQIGNDTDPKRQPRYKEMACQVSAACELAPGTMRILERTFGQVRVV